MASLKQIASEVGVSVTAASVILNSPDGANRFSDECVHLVREAAKRLNYHRNHRAGSLRAGCSKVLGLLLPLAREDKLIPRDDWGMMMEGIDVAAYDNGYTTILVRGDNNNEMTRAGMRFYRERRVDGLIIPEIPDIEVLEELYEFEGPVVVLNRPGVKRFSNVQVDEQEGVRLALDHLKGLGHWNVIWVGPRNLQGRPTHQRANTFRSLAHEMGMGGDICEFNVIDDSLLDMRKMIITQSQNAIMKFIERGGLFSGVICNDEFTARGVYNALEEINFEVPDKCSVVVYGDRVSSFFQPTLTSISEPMFDTGFEACRLLMQMIQNKHSRNNSTPPAPVGFKEKDTVELLLKPELIVRNSTALAGKEPSSTDEIVAIA